MSERYTYDPSKLALVDMQQPGTTITGIPHEKLHVVIQRFAELEVKEVVTRNGRETVQGRGSHRGPETWQIVDKLDAVVRKPSKRGGQILVMANPYTVIVGDPIDLQDAPNLRSTKTPTKRQSARRFAVIGELHGTGGAYGLVKGVGAIVVARVPTFPAPGSQYEVHLFFKPEGERDIRRRLDDVLSDSAAMANLIRRNNITSPANGGAPGLVQQG